jgi:hypothetical protein
MAENNFLASLAGISPFMGVSGILRQVLRG